MPAPRPDREDAAEQGEAIGPGRSLNPLMEDGDGNPQAM